MEDISSISDSFRNAVALALRRFRETVNDEYRLRNLNAPGARRDIEFDMDTAPFREVYESCREFTMTPIERIYSLYESTHYVINNRIAGDFVECGVWRGGSIMVICKSLLSQGSRNRRIYMYDTFECMTEPSSRDVLATDGSAAFATWNRNKACGRNYWACCSVDEVKRNVLSTGYDPDKLLFVKGPVEKTLRKTVPEQISLLRLDTDFYESTKCEIEILFPRLSVGGVIILDDYGYWRGAKDAVDEYFAKEDVKMLLSRIDHSCRLGVKLEP